MDRKLVEYTSPHGMFVQHRILDTKYKVKASSHFQYEILLLVQGEMKVVINGNSYTLTAGEIIIVDVHEYHSMEMLDGVKTELMVIQFSPDALPSYVHLKFTDYCKNNPMFSHKIPSEFVKNAKIKDIMESACKLFDGENKSQLEIYLAGEICNLVAEVNVALDEFASSGSFKLHDGTENQLINNCVRYINDNIYSEITIDDIAKNNFVSRSYLQHSFKKIFGVSVTDFILNQKMTLARYMLLTGSSPTKVAQNLGFQYYTTFYAKFKKFFGFSPKRLNVSAIVSNIIKD